MSLTLARESFAQALPDALPLLEKHWREIAFYHDIPLAIDLEFYRQCEAVGVLRIYTARQNDTKLVGYAVFFVRQAPHYMGSLQAVEDVFYVDQNNRGSFVGMRLLRHSERALRDEGVQVVMHHSKARHPQFGKLLMRHGYEQQDLIWSKRLDCLNLKPIRRAASKPETVEA